jgi:hypothetical protein
LADNHEITIPDEALATATKAVDQWLLLYTLPANYTLDREYNQAVSEANSENIARVALQAALSIIAADAWEQGVIHGHNIEGRLIDKLDNNPYESKA